MMRLRQLWQTEANTTLLCVTVFVTSARQIHVECDRSGATRPESDASKYAFYLLPPPTAAGVQLQTLLLFPTCLNVSAPSTNYYSSWFCLVCVGCLKLTNTMHRSFEIIVIPLVLMK